MLMYWTSEFFHPAPNIHIIHNTGSGMDSKADDGLETGIINTYDPWVLVAHSIKLLVTLKLERNKAISHGKGCFIML